MIDGQGGASTKACGVPARSTHPLPGVGSPRGPAFVGVPPSGGLRPKAPPEGGTPTKAARLANEIGGRVPDERALTGCLTGTAVGDALGLPTEGLSPRRARRLFPDVDRYHFLFGRGMFS